MQDGIHGQEKTYWTKDISDNLSIGTSTLRKWCLLLEENGYLFLRDEHGRRAYTEHDAIALRKFKELTTEKAMSLENASIAVISAFKRAQNDDITLSATQQFPRPDERYKMLENKFEEYAEQQKAFNQALLERLDEQQEYIENSLKVRDERLMQTLNEVLETKRLLAAAQEQPKKKWYQFWK